MSPNFPLLSKFFGILWFVDHNIPGNRDFEVLISTVTLVWCVFTIFMDKIFSMSYKVIIMGCDCLNVIDHFNYCLRQSWYFHTWFGEDWFRHWVIIRPLLMFLFSYVLCCYCKSFKDLSLWQLWFFCICWLGYLLWDDKVNRKCPSNEQDIFTFLSFENI